MSCWENSCRTFAVFFFLCTWDIVFRFTFHYCCLLSALHYPSWIKTFGGALALRSTGKYTMALPVNKSTKGMREEINRPMTFTVLHCGTGFKPFIYLTQACKQCCLPLFKLAYLVKIFLLFLLFVLTGILFGQPKCCWTGLKQRSWLMMKWWLFVEFLILCSRVLVDLRK